MHAIGSASGRMFTAGEAFVIQKRYMRVDGSDVWVLDNVTPISGCESYVIRRNGCLNRYYGAQTGSQRGRLHLSPKSRLLIPPPSSTRHKFLLLCAQLMNYTFQSFNFRGRQRLRPYYDLISNSPLRNTAILSSCPLPLIFC